MARRKLPDRVICIEERPSGRLRFRLHYVADGRRMVKGYETRAEADEAEARYTRLTAPLHSEPVRELLTRYQQDMVGRRFWRADAKALQTKTQRLANFLEPIADMPVKLVTPAMISKCCRAWDTPGRPAYNTRKDARIKAAAFFAWCERQRLIASSPLGEEHAVAHERPAKQRLRIDDARRLRAVLDPAADTGDASAIFVLAGLILGMRSSELMSLTPASLDDGGRVLTYLDAKDRDPREVRLPALLQAPLKHLSELAAGREDGLLFGRHAHTWPAAVTRRWAREAGIQGWEELDARWLRRTKDTLAVEAGVSADVVARETGHSLQIARRHYIGSGAEVTGRAAAMEAATAAGNDCPDNRTASAKVAKLKLV